MQEVVHDAERLKELQALPLERKIQISQARIIEWYQHWKGQVCVSFSGGKDSTVLLHLVHQIYPDVKAVFVNTGLEYPEIQRFAMEKGADIVTPSLRFNEVITTYGYPLIGKEVAEAIYYARRIRSQDVHVERERERTAERKQRELQGRRKQNEEGQTLLADGLEAERTHGGVLHNLSRAEQRKISAETSSGSPSWVAKPTQQKDHLIQTGSARNRRTVLQWRWSNGSTTNRESGGETISTDDSEPG